MSKLIEWLAHGCWHHWIETARYDIVDYDTTIGKAVYCSCSKCGKPTVFNLYLDDE